MVKPGGAAPATSFLPIARRDLAQLAETAAVDHHKVPRITSDGGTPN